MAGDNIEDADWEEIPGNDGKLSKERSDDEVLQPRQPDVDGGSPWTNLGFWQSIGADASKGCFFLVLLIVVGSLASTIITPSGPSLPSEEPSEATPVPYELPIAAANRGVVDGNCHMGDCEFFKFGKRQVIREGIDGFGNQAKLVRLDFKTGFRTDTSSQAAIKWSKKSDDIFALCDAQHPVSLEIWRDNQGKLIEPQTAVFDLRSGTGALPDVLINSGILWGEACYDDPHVMSNEVGADQIGVGELSDEDRNATYSNEVDLWENRPVLYTTSTKSTVIPDSPQDLIPAQAVQSNLASLCSNQDMINASVDPFKEAVGKVLLSVTPNAADMGLDETFLRAMLIGDHLSKSRFKFLGIRSIGIEGAGSRMVTIRCQAKLHLVEPISETNGVFSSYVQFNNMQYSIRIKNPESDNPETYILAEIRPVNGKWDIITGTE